MKKLIYLFVFIICIIPIYALDKPLNISISNCYEINISVDQEEGTYTDINFAGCNKISQFDFNCKCLNLANNNFSIILQTDGYPIHESRNYDLSIRIATYDLNLKSNQISVTDLGDIYDLGTLKTRNITKANTIKVIEYRNITEYINQTIYTPYEVIVFKDRNITINNTMVEYKNISIYYENETKINSKNNEIKKLKFQKNVWIIFSIILTIILSVISYLLVRYIKNEEK